MRSGGIVGWAASYGVTRVCLLVAFVICATLTYFYLDASTIYKFLTQVQNDPYGTLPAFLLVYTLSVVLLFPCMILQVMSGALYGFWVGMLVSWLATSGGQSLAFLLGRYLFRPTVKSYLHATWPTFPAIDAAIKKEGWKLVCLLRLSPVLPYNILNYALAITPVSFVVFSAASALATIPWTALYVYLGTFSTDLMELTQGKVNYGGDMKLLKSVASGIFIIFTTVYGYMLSHRAVVAVLRESAAASPTVESSATNGHTGLNGLSDSHDTLVTLTSEATPLLAGLQPTKAGIAAGLNGFAASGRLDRGRSGADIELGGLGLLGGLKN